MKLSERKKKKKLRLDAQEFLKLTNTATDARLISFIAGETRISSPPISRFWFSTTSGRGGNGGSKVGGPFSPTHVVAGRKIGSSLALWTWIEVDVRSEVVRLVCMLAFDG